MTRSSEAHELRDSGRTATPSRGVGDGGAVRCHSLFLQGTRSRGVEPVLLRCSSICVETGAAGGSLQDDVTCPAPPESLRGDAMTSRPRLFILINSRNPKQ